MTERRKTPTRRAAAGAKRDRGEAEAETAPPLSDRGAEDIAFVTALAQLLREHDLGELEVTREYGDDDELKVRLSRTSSAAPVATVAAPMALAPQPANPALPAPRAASGEAGDAAPAGDGADPSAHPGCVTSPMVGTVYLAAEPSAPPFVSAGDRVEEGQTVVIVEAMKTMNHIPSPRGGVVREVLVSNEQPVEFGAPLLIIE